MKWILRSAILAIALVSTAYWCQPAMAQPRSEFVNPKIDLRYVPPKSLKYLPVFDRVQKFKLLEQLRDFFSPVRLPHQFTMTATECGMVNAFYSPRDRLIALCYELIEAMERLGSKQQLPPDITYEDFVVGVITAVMLHELGHAVFDMLNVPVFGREEDGADGIAAYIAVQFSPQVALKIVKGFAYYKKLVEFGAPFYSDEHGTNLQRYYNTLCLAYGSDQSQLFKKYVDQGDLPKSRADGCRQEYLQVAQAFEKTILPFVDRDLMKNVQARSWLQLAPDQAALLKQQQQEVKDTFTFAVCNEGQSTKISVALMYRPVADPQKWLVSGWYNIPDRGCDLIGTFYGDRIYWYAEAVNPKGQRVSWSARADDKTASKQCVDPSKPFQLAAEGKCQSGQTMVNFIRRDVHPFFPTVKAGLR